MADPAPTTRRSGRTRKPNQKYSVDPFEGLDILSTDSEEEARAQEQDDSSEDGDFAIEKAANAAESPEADDLSMVEGSGASDRSGADTPVEHDGQMMSVDDPGKPGKAVRGTRRSRHFEKAKASLKLQGAHTRGVPDPSQYAQKDLTLNYTFGTGTEELLSLVRSRDKWARDPTLPTRTANEHGAGGMGHSFSHTEEKRTMEATVGWDWYYNNGGGDRLTKCQKIRHVGVEEGYAYLPHPAKSSQSLLMGPYGRQNLYSLEIGESFNFKDAWSSTYDLPNHSDGDQNSRKGRREGWILNLGGKIKCLDWMPNQEGSVQILAICTLVSALEASNGEPQPQGGPSKAPAFTPAPPTPACIQIWAFSTSTATGQEGSLDLTRNPKLQMVICTEWGDVRHLKWCPIPRNSREADGNGNEALGLLAGIWGDGRIKVLDLRISREWDSPTEYVKFDTPAFDVRPPKTLCTCLTWLSSSDIAVGCANGFVAIYSISHPPPENPPISPPDDDTPPCPSTPAPIPIPWFYHSLHATYVLTITSAYPSAPHLLITTSMDGYPRLTDIRAPTTDTVVGTRSRIGHAVLAWCDPISSAISADENDFLRLYPLRRFFSSLNVGRCEADVLSLAVGTAHPCVLAGAADGAVVATNPMRKVLNSKAVQAQQIWFRHEWTRVGGGMVRFVEGFKVESTKLAKSLLGDPRVRDGMVFATIYEKETGVTALAWNPNVICGGWAAAGMGSGLVRVEDLAL